MAKLLWAIPCARIIIDRETNTVSYIDSVRGLTTLQLPAPMLPIYIGTVWERTQDEETLNMRVRLLNEDGKEIAVAGPPPIELKSNVHRVNVRLPNVSITSYGTYSIIVEHKKTKRWAVVASIPLEIRSRDELNQRLPI